MLVASNSTIVVKDLAKSTKDAGEICLELIRLHNVNNLVDRLRLLTAVRLVLGWKDKATRCKVIRARMVNLVSFLYVASASGISTVL